MEKRHCCDPIRPRGAIRTDDDDECPDKCIDISCENVSFGVTCE